MADERENRADAPIRLFVPEERCFFCGEEMRDGRCGRRCHASQRHDEARKDRVDREG